MLGLDRSLRDQARRYLV